MQIEIGKSYMTRNGRFVKITDKPFENLFNADIEEDGRDVIVPRYKEDGTYEDYLFGGSKLNNPDLDIIMEDSYDARVIAERMRRERKKKAFDETN